VYAYLYYATGGKIYLACRSVERAQNAVDEMVSSSGIDRRQLLVMHLDLASMDSIRKFAKEFKSSELHSLEVNFFIQFLSGM
jgi:NAD(P)-dependent dehydrogenase (short-subunit alcohol dehydrogenase family)